MSKRYILTSFLWGLSAKLFDAGIKFISVPLLLAYFGKDEFGLITLANSVNAYLQLLDMGVNTGAIKYFSEWISQKKYALIDSVARTSISFYGIIGIINAVVLIIIAFWGMSVFSITHQQAEVLRNLFLILAFFTVLNWSTSVFNQLLTANHDIQYVQRVGIFKSVANLLIIYLTIWYKLNIESYFILFSIANSFIIIPFYIKARKKRLISNFLPKNDWANFGRIFKYSLAIIAMAVFQMSATKLRPIVLSIFSQNVTETLTEYRIMETITLFIISVGGMLISILLPTTSKLVLEKDDEKIRNFAYKTTSFTTIICAFLCLPFIIGAKEILELYVGKSYVHLYLWLSIWVTTILFYLHNSPIASLVLSIGKTRMLVISSAISSIVSLVINAFFAKYLGVGSAVLGYGVYILIQMGVYYFYFNSRILHLNSWKVFKSFITPVLIGMISSTAVIFLVPSIHPIYLYVLIKLAIWGVLYIFSLIVTSVLKINDITVLVKKKL